MGAGASVVEDFVTKEKGRELAGALWEELRFDSEANSEGVVSREAWNAAVLTSVPLASKEDHNPATPGDCIAYKEVEGFVKPDSHALLRDSTPDISSENLEVRTDALLALDETGVEAHTKLVLDTIAERERVRKRRAKDKLKEASIDYSKSLSGTKEDSKAEKDFANLMKESGGRTELPDGEYAEILRAITQRDTNRYEELRSKGKWIKIDVVHGDGLLGVAWIHNLTCEESYSRPHDFFEDVASQEVVVDPFCGLSSCPMEDILERIAVCIAGDEASGVEPKTPLLIDTSPERKMAAFFKYKGAVIELECLGWSRKRQADEKISVKQEMEFARKVTVNAMKHGKTLCIDLGMMGSNCPLKEVHCKDTTLHPYVFERGGKKLISGKPQPFCKKMWKDNEKISGEIVIDTEFRVVLLTSQPPSEVLKELAEPIPLELVEPIVVTFGS